MESPRTLEEYIALVVETIEEADDFLACIDDADPEENWERYRMPMERILAGLRQLLADLKEGLCKPPMSAVPPFFEDIDGLAADVPIRSLLREVARVYREGFLKQP
ncbi:hypothetical protein [Pelomicrobium methylotrophicum]|uniref:Uncharacterized protein n=1 Tax=Pelomicrobium methylotrophicum TaxID=2602750 RepID=A0A5C7EIW7_9PROT|nr:hypothetical protein [Pelomicrobium methylotrophicum]TXF11368.1 hypothetical protein FR698_10735 [Pelomicrobium methylotrophicum]